MEKGNQLIHSFNHSEGYQGNFDGLTKREYFAGLAMQGLLSRNIKMFEPSPEELCLLSVKFSDELLKQLEDKQS